MEKSYFKNATLSPLCTHEIWFYAGSYMCENDVLGQSSLCIDESCDNFSYNLYYCLECGGWVQTSRWQEFEETHFVLKNREHLDVNKYKKLYRRLIIENSHLEAKRLIIREFNGIQKSLRR